MPTSRRSSCGISVGGLDGGFAALGCRGAVAALTGLLIVRRQGVYFVMFTLAFAQMGFFLALALPKLTGGENGFGNVPLLDDRIWTVTAI